MKHFGLVCYAVCLTSTAVFLVLALVNIWGEVTEESMKAMVTALAFLFASGVAFAVNRVFTKEPRQNTKGTKESFANVIVQIVA